MLQTAKVHHGSTEYKVQYLKDCRILKISIRALMPFIKHYYSLWSELKPPLKRSQKLFTINHSNVTATGVHNLNTSNLRLKFPELEDPPINVNCHPMFMKAIPDHVLDMWLNWIAGAYSEGLFVEMFWVTV